MLIKSIRGRFLLWLAFLLVTVLSGFGVTAYQLHRTNQISAIDEQLSRLLNRLESFTGIRGPFPGPPPPGSRRSRNPSDWPPARTNPSDNRALFTNVAAVANGLNFRLGPREIRIPREALAAFDQEGGGAYFAVWSRGGALTAYPPVSPGELIKPELVPGVFTPVARMRGPHRELLRHNEVGECFLVGRSIAEEMAAIHRFGWLLVLAGSAVLALGLGGGWRLVTTAMRPVENISAAATRIAQGNLSDRIRLRDSDGELGRLAETLNVTFARLEASFAHQRQFTADAAHELRTPIAVLISETQTALARERSAADYREAVQECLAVAQQMRRLTESLLDLTRYDSGQEHILKEDTDLAAIASDCVNLVQPLADKRQVQLHADLQPAPCPADPQRVSQVITNLLSNAICYNRPGGLVRVATRSNQAHAILEISDNGPGIAPEHLPRIFERFYRADHARSRAEGHSGLGLAICQAIIHSHGGAITAASPPGSGATFTVNLPVQDFSNPAASATPARNKIS